MVEDVRRAEGTYNPTEDSQHTSQGSPGGEDQSHFIDGDLGGRRLEHVSGSQKLLLEGGGHDYGRMGDTHQVEDVGEGRGDGVVGYGGDDDMEDGGRGEEARIGGTHDLDDEDGPGEGAVAQTEEGHLHRHLAVPPLADFEHHVAASYNHGVE